MKLHVVHGSPNSRKPLTVIHHLKLDVELHPKNVMAGDLGKEEFLAINPNGMVPCLEDGDFKLWESNAIMQYLADAVPGNKLFPADRRARADIERWQCWELAHFNKAISAIVWENFVKGYFNIGLPDPAIIESATADLHRFAPVLDKQVSAQAFVCGNQPTLADYSVGCWLMYTDAGKLPLDDYKNIKAWFQRVEQLPGWAASAPPAA